MSAYSPTPKKPPSITLTISTPHGLHPKLLISFPPPLHSLPSSTSTPNCTSHNPTYTLTLHLPPSLFIDRYELARRALPPGISITTYTHPNGSDKTDLEAPIWSVKSHPPAVVKVGVEEGSWCHTAAEVKLELPIHIRYHLPTSRPNTSHVNVSLPLPTVFYHSADAGGEEAKVRYEKPKATYPQRQYLVEESGEFLLEVPIGYLGDLNSVNWLTQIVVWAGVVLVFLAMFWRRGVGGRIDERRSVEGNSAKAQ